jgi:hypothetical protein
MKHIRVFIKLFGTVDYCLKGFNAKEDQVPEIAAAAAVLSKYLPIHVEVADHA